MTIAEEDTQVTTLTVLAGNCSHLIICLYLWPLNGVKTTFIALTTPCNLVCRLLLEKKKKKNKYTHIHI